MRTIFLVDDHPVMRYAYRTVIEETSDLEVCGEAASAEEALEQIPEMRPDLVIADISMAGMDGITLTARLRQMDPPVLVLVASQHQEVVYVKRALQAGASGYLTKRNAATHLLSAIRSILGNNFYLSDMLKHRIKADNNNNNSNNNSNFLPSVLTRNLSTAF